MTRAVCGALLLSLTGVAGATGVVASAENWPQWRGPAANGVSGETNLPLRWSKTENIAWSLRMPDRSGATPIVWGDRIFLNVAEAGNLYLWAVDRTTGQPLWKKRLGGGDRRERKQNMSSPSPVTDGRHVWIMTGTGVLKAFDSAGTEIWTRDLQADYGRFGLNWGYASSPLLHGDGLFVQVLHGMKTDDASYVLKIDKATGKTLWRVERPTAAVLESPDSYTTPAVIQGGGQSGGSTEIVVTGGDVATGHDPASGKELWRLEGLNPDNQGMYRIVASPVVFGGTIIVPTRERPMMAVRAGGRGNVTKSHRLWSFDNGPDVPTPVTDGTYVYIVRDNGTMWCLDFKTGQPLYSRERLAPGTYSSSPVLADGRVYVTNEDGVTSVVKAGTTFELLAQNDLGEYTLSSPAISGGRIYIRTDSALYAVGPKIARP